jgi:hypothetical protein
MPPDAIAILICDNFEKHKAELRFPWKALPSRNNMAALLIINDPY